MKKKKEKENVMATHSCFLLRAQKLWIGYNSICKIVYNNKNS